MLPSLPLGDSLCALSGVIGALSACYYRDVVGGPGQHVDVSMYEPILQMIAPTIAAYERGGAVAVDGLPGGRDWREAVEAYTETERHLAIHEGHLVMANPRDEPHVADLIPLASATALVGTAQQVSERVAGFGALGVTELVYQPSGSDIERELRTFASAMGLQG